ncbi:MAG: hypothetical protein AAGI34_09415 [Pseudomonadota bacterium]
MRDSALKATIWRNDGQNGAYHTVNLSRTYKDNDGQFHDTASFRVQDMLPLAELARETHARASVLNRDAFHEQRRAEPAPD